MATGHFSLTLVGQGELCLHTSSSGSGTCLKGPPRAHGQGQPGLSCPHWPLPGVLTPPQTRKCAPGRTEPHIPHCHYFLHPDRARLFSAQIPGQGHGTVTRRAGQWEPSPVPCPPHIPPLPQDAEAAQAAAGPAALAVVRIVSTQPGIGLCLLES